MLKGHTTPLTPAPLRCSDCPAQDAPRPLILSSKTHALPQLPYHLSQPLLTALTYGLRPDNPTACSPTTCYSPKSSLACSPVGFASMNAFAQFTTATRTSTTLSLNRFRNSPNTSGYSCANCRPGRANKRPNNATAFKRTFSLSFCNPPPAGVSPHTS